MSCFPCIDFGGNFGMLINVFSQAAGALVKGKVVEVSNEYMMVAYTSEGQQPQKKLYRKDPARSCPVTLKDNGQAHQEFIQRWPNERGTPESRSVQKQGGSSRELGVMTINFQFFASYPADEWAAQERLREVLGGPQAPDIVCVQEGLAHRNVLAPLDFELCVCSAQRDLAQSVYDMTYGDELTLKSCGQACQSHLLCNQIYVRKTSPWVVADSGAMAISSERCLTGSNQRAQGELAIRSMVWVKLASPQARGPSVYVMCTHITGGRFEDQYFLQQLEGERFDQTERILSFFDHASPPHSDDVGILVGDFNATQKYSSEGAMAGYFKSAIATAPGVRNDAAEAGLTDKETEDRFKQYMISPFKALLRRGWTFAYDEEAVGVTSAFGHLVDHMATSTAVPSQATVYYLTNQRIGNKPKDTDLVLTDHNAVKTIFTL